MSLPEKTRSDFWSRRKAAVEAEARAEEAAAQAALDEQTEAELATRDDEEILTELGLSSPEALETPEQVRAFLSEAVPQRLRVRALRRLWGLNPVLANLDGLVDYGEDFTDAATVVENLQTVYQVGKGMFDKALEEAEAVAEDEGPSDEKDSTETALDALADNTDGAEDDTGADTSQTLVARNEPSREDHAAATQPDFDDDIETFHGAPRRMRFHFATAQ